MGGGDTVRNGDSLLDLLGENAGAGGISTVALEADDVSSCSSSEVVVGLCFPPSGGFPEEFRCGIVGTCELRSARPRSSAIDAPVAET